ncbi:MAG: transglutaminase family protein [Gammaproteobacteria bacterium]
MPQSNSASTWQRLGASIFLSTASAVGFVSANAAERELYSYEVPVVFKGAQLPRQSDVLQMRIKSANAATLAENLKHSTVVIDKIKRRFLTVTLEGADTLSGEPEAAHRSASYLVDYREPAMEAFSGKFAATQSGDVSISAMTEFVHGSMGPSPYMRSFDIASVVAASGTGDCTEHALLLTGLARAQGFAARVVLGSVVVSSTDRARAYGHAWSEIWHDGAWHIADATVAADGSDFAMHYLPVGEVRNEGLGFVLGLVGITQLMPEALERVRIVN